MADGPTSICPHQDKTPHGGVSLFFQWWEEWGFGRLQVEPSGSQVAELLRRLEATKTDEIEITPEMIEAGVEAYFSVRRFPHDDLFDGEIAPNYPVDTTMPIDSSESDRAAQPEAPATEIEVTPEMIAAGVRILRENYLSLGEPDEYQTIVQTLFCAMAACSFAPPRRV